MAALVTLYEAKGHLKITGVEEDADLTMKLNQATAIVVNYLKRTDLGSPVDIEDIDPTELSVLERWIVKAAILKVLGNLDRFRGDEDKGENAADEMFLTPDIRGILSMLRDPALA